MGVSKAGSDVGIDQRANVADTNGADPGRERASRGLQFGRHAGLCDARSDQVIDRIDRDGWDHRARWIEDPWNVSQEQQLVSE
jgi:hypothetical protein